MLITIQNSAKPADVKFILKPVTDAAGEVKNFKNKDPKLNNHVQTVADGFNLFVWAATVSTIPDDHAYRVISKTT